MFITKDANSSFLFDHRVDYILFCQKADTKSIKSLRLVKSTHSRSSLAQDKLINSVLMGSDPYGALWLLKAHTATFVSLWSAIRSLPDLAGSNPVTNGALLDLLQEVLSCLTI